MNIKAKNTLKRKEKNMNTASRKKEVVTIPAEPKFSGPQSWKTPVAAYARVSTNNEDQLNSYEAQVDYYKHKIKKNPKWDYVGIFADEGLSGTSLKKRDAFNRMIKLCEKDKIKLILCKSFSRFARNTVDCINIIRMLKSRGIAVHFEKENINTLKESSEFLITLFSGFAQAESESMSANIKWGM